MSSAFAPMLATTKAVTEVPSGWIVEPKLDGSSVLSECVLLRP